MKEIIKLYIMFFVILSIIIIGIIQSVYYLLNEFENFETNEISLDYHVIHMEKSKKRMKIIEENNSKLNGKQFKIFNAIDANDITDKRDLSMYDPDIINKFEDTYIGEVGCYLSHYLLLKKIQDSKESDYSVIFEDDGKIQVENFDKEVVKIINDMKDIDFGIIYLGIISPNSHKDKVVENVYTLNFESHLFGAHAYLVKNSNIPKILKWLNEFTEAIDVKIKNAMANNVFPVYIVYPDLVNQVDEISYIRGKSYFEKFRTYN